MLSILGSDWSIYVLLLSLPQQLLLLAHRAGDHLEEIEEIYYPDIKKTFLYRTIFTALVIFYHFES